MTRPDDKTETAGLLVLDEPRAKQSDPTVLDLQLRTLTKQTTVKPVVRRPLNIHVLCTVQEEAHINYPLLYETSLAANTCSKLYDILVCMCMCKCVWVSEGGVDLCSHTHRLCTVLRTLTRTAKLWTTGSRVLVRSTARSHPPLYTTPSKSWTYTSLCNVIHIDCMGRWYYV